MGKVSFIIYYDEERCLQECIYYIQELAVPVGIEVEILHVKNVESLAEVRSMAVQKIQSSYKVYLDQNMLIINKFFLYEILSLFKKEQNVRVIGVLGSDGTGEDNQGRILLWSEDGIGEANCTSSRDAIEAHKISEIIVATQNDAEWTEHPIIPYQNSSWCLYDCRADKGTGLEQEYRYQLLRAEIFHDRESWEKIGSLLKDKRLTLPQQVQRAERQAFAKTMMGYYWEDYYCSQRKWKKCLPANGRISLEKSKNSTMNIVMAFNHGYVDYALVMLQSLYENNGLSPICVHVLQVDLTEEDKGKLETQAGSFEQLISFYSFDKAMLPDGLKITTEWSVEAYFRLFMTDILPESVDRILYLDVDVIINKPIYDFYYMDMQGYEIVGCRDFSLILQDGFKDKRQELFASVLQEEEFVYINSGVMLVDLQGLRGKICGADYMKIAWEQQDKLLAPDQDIINLMHWKNIGLVDEYRYDFFNACFKGVTVEEVRQQVSIIHYAGPKPWMPIDIKLHAHRIWWEYAELLKIGSKVI